MYVYLVFFECKKCACFVSYDAFSCCLVVAVMGKSQIRCDSQISDISADCLSEFEIPFVFNFKADLK